MSLTPQQLEARIQELALNAPRRTPAEIEAMIIGETYTALPSGKVMVCELTLYNGFTVRGEAAVVSKANFNEEIGREVSRRRAVDEVWKFAGFILQETLYRVALSEGTSEEGKQTD